ncbi:nicotinate (nicotinamide) nucleotide adenylyltransferase [Alistipes sp. OttesenSCG-928-B03]|nr:nicotinate (nicotinamide) nucleotide adenylyltransferase [Alistipes sp. OttesenSCG-928-B03]
MSRIILYFGSFNPIHNGHTSVARYVLESGLCDELWFVVSPQNPLKERAELAADADRLKMAEIAVAETLPGGRVRVCDVEFHMPRPSYTIDTLRELGRQHPDDEFALLTGTDIMHEFDRWKEHDALLHDYRIYVYPREGYSLGEYEGRVEYLAGAPRWDYSSTDMRREVAAGGDIGGMVARGVADYIEQHRLWSAAATNTDNARDADNDFPNEVARLDSLIATDPSATNYMERGKFYNRAGQFNKALNDFMKAQELDPDNAEARTYITMIREIYAFRYLDYYNP